MTQPRAHGLLAEAVVSDGAGGSEQQHHEAHAHDDRVRPNSNPTDQGTWWCVAGGADAVTAPAPSAAQATPLERCFGAPERVARLAAPRTEGMFLD